MDSRCTQLLPTTSFRTYINIYLRQQKSSQIVVSILHVVRTLVQLRPQPPPPLRESRHRTCNKETASNTITHTITHSKRLFDGKYDCACSLRVDNSLNPLGVLRSQSIGTPSPCRFQRFLYIRYIVSLFTNTSGVYQYNEYN
jgi:hypothetical protein